MGRREDKICRHPGCYLRGYTISTRVTRCIACAGELSTMELGDILGGLFGGQRVRR